jgi:Leucine-rich repeat (LRR) protein
MREAKEATADSSASHLLSIVLGQLSGSDDDRQLCGMTARTLHRVSKQHQADARATLHHLALDRYYQGLRSAYPDASSRPAAVPRGLLTACPAVTSWELDPEQLQCFRDPAWTLDEQMAAAASRIKRLEVKGISSSSKAQQEGFGRLLWACNQLEEVDISCSGDPGKPWLMLDPDSTSGSTPRVPSAPLHSWRSHGMPQSLVYKWLEQQQARPAPTLKCVSTSSSGGEDLSQLAGLRGLEELRLSYDDFPLPPGISSSLSSVTKLALGTDAEEHLEELSAFSRLSCLNMAMKAEVPADLGETLPNLQRLEAPAPFLTYGRVYDQEGKCLGNAALTSLTGLTRLGLAYCNDSNPLPPGLVRLKELDVSYAQSELDHTSDWTALEVLDAFGNHGIDTLTALQPLTRLRHLNLGEVAADYGWDASSFTVLGTLQQLTRLSLRQSTVTSPYQRRAFSGPCAACCAALAGTEPLPALQQLDLAGQEVGSDSALAPWVAKHTALTSLNLSGGEVAAGDELLYLPTQLRELHLAPMPHMGNKLPRGLLRLPALEVLSLAHNWGLKQLPTWLSQLRQLEVLDLDKTSVCTEQPVLAQMPALRCVKLDAGASPAVMFASTPHLHWGHSKRFSCWGHVYYSE